MINTLTDNPSETLSQKILLLLTIRFSILLALGHAVTMIFISNQWLVPVVLDMGLCIAFGGAWGLVYLKHFRIARAWILGSYWFYITIGSVLLGGLENPLLGAYIVFVLIVGLLYNSRWALYALFLSISTILAIAIAQINQLLPTSVIELTPAYLGLNILGTTISVALLMYFFLSIIQDTANKTLQYTQEIALQREQNLAALHAVTIDLTNCDSLDDVFRSAVVLGRSMLNFDRLGLFLLDDNPQTIVGTYGIDEQGHVINENYIFRPLADTVIFKQTLATRQKIFVQEDVDLTHNWKVVGHGWHVTLTLWNGDKIFGWLLADNLFSQEPLTKVKIDLLSSYSTTLAQLIVRKQAEDNFRYSQRNLQATSESLSIINKIAERLHQSHDMDSVFKSMADAFISLLNSQVVIAYMLDEGKQNLNLVFEVNEFSQSPTQLPLENTLSGYVIAHRTVAISQDLWEDDRLYQMTQLSETNLKALVFIPIIFGDNVFGVIVLGFAHEIRQEISDYQTYTAIGQTVGLALSNIRFINEIQLEKTLSDSIIESIPNIFFMFSEAGELVRWNENLAELLGYDSQALQQMPASTLMTNSDKDSLDALLEKTMTTGSDSAYLHINTRHQGNVPHIISTRRYHMQGKRYIIGTGTDLSDRMQLLGQLQHQATQLLTAGDISKSIVTVLDTHELMQYSVDLVCQRFDYYFVGLFIADKEKRFAILGAGSSDVGRKMLESDFRLAIDKQSMAGRSISNAKIIIAPNIAEETGHYANPNLPDTRSEMALPLMNRGECLGAMLVHSTQLNAFSSDDSAAMRFIADHLASAIVNARLYEFINRRQRYFGTLRHVTQRAMPERNLNVFMQTVVKALSVDFQYEFAAIFRIDHDAAVIRVGAYVDRKNRKLSGKQWSINVGILGWVAQNAMPYICYDSTNDPYYTAPPNIAPLPRSVVATPIIQYDTVMGILVVRQAGANSLSHLDLEILSELATEVGLHMENIRLYAQTQQNTAELERRVDARTSQLQTVNHELESFAYSVSHDLRAPLRSIDGFSQALMEDYHDALDDGGKHFLTRVRAASQRMGQLIDDLLTLSRVTRREFKQESVNLSVMATEIIDILQQDEPQREIDVVVEDGIMAEGDARMLRIVLENILGNAWKFTNMRDKALIELTCQKQDNTLIYCVRDNGIGFDMKYEDKLFHAFQRLHGMNEFEGTGIGLATVKRVIDRHGGRIWFDAKVDEGATFFFTVGDVLPTDYNNKATI